MIREPFVIHNGWDVYLTSHSGKLDNRLEERLEDLSVDELKEWLKRIIDYLKNNNIIGEDKHKSPTKKGKKYLVRYILGSREDNIYNLDPIEDGYKQGNLYKTDLFIYSPKLQRAIILGYNYDEIDDLYYFTIVTLLPKGRTKISNKTEETYKGIIEQTLNYLLSIDDYLNTEYTNFKKDKNEMLILESKNKDIKKSIYLLIFEKVDNEVFIYDIVEHSIPLYFNIIK